MDHNYFIVLKTHKQRKNSLHKALYKFLNNSIDRRVVPANNAKVFIEELESEVVSINKQHRRCSPANVGLYSFNHFDNKGDEHIYICGDLFTLVLYLMRK